MKPEHVVSVAEVRAVFRTLIVGATAEVDRHCSTGIELVAAITFAAQSLGANRDLFMDIGPNQA